MKPKNLILLFIFGLFLFLLPSLAEAIDINCDMSCEICLDYSADGLPYCTVTAADRANVIGLLGPETKISGCLTCSDCSHDVSNSCIDPRDSNQYTCGEGFFKVPTIENNGTVCRVADSYNWPMCSTYIWTGYGNWDASEDKCIQCSSTGNHTEAQVLGNSSTIYANNDNKTGNAGDGLCEAGCAASSTCDEHSPGYACETGKTCDSNCQCVTACACTSTTIGGCCDGCNYCSAGKVFNGTSCVDATSTIKCASTVNNCTAGSCSGEKRYPECQAGGTCDSTATSYYTSETVYASAGKVFTSSCTDQDATSQSLACDSNTNYFCTAGNCSGYYRYSECKADHTCDTAATTNYYQVDVTASAGKVLSSTCGNQNATSTVECASTVNNCTAVSCSGEKRYPECQAGGTCDSSATTYYTSETVYASAGYSLTSGCGTTGSTLCGSSYLASTAPGDNYYGDGGSDSCQGMCDGSGNCYYAVNCKGATNNPPTCTSLTPDKTSINVGETVVFTGAGSDSDGTISEYEFDFGDGSAKVYSSTAGATHTYNTSGTFCAKLRVQDDDGAWSTNTGDCPGGTCTAPITVTTVVGISPPAVETLPINDSGHPGTVTQNSATVWGKLISCGGANIALVWFKWGPTTSMGNSTSYQTIDCTTVALPYYFNSGSEISGLTSNQIYYFEAFAKNGGSW